MSEDRSIRSRIGELIEDASLERSGRSISTLTCDHIAGAVLALLVDDGWASKERHEAEVRSLKAEIEVWKGLYQQAVAGGSGLKTPPGTEAYCPRCGHHMVDGRICVVPEPQGLDEPEPCGCAHVFHRADDDPNW